MKLKLDYRKSNPIGNGKFISNRFSVLDCNPGIHELAVLDVDMHKKIITHYRSKLEIPPMDPYEYKGSKYIQELSYIWDKFIIRPPFIKTHYEEIRIVMYDPLGYPMVILDENGKSVKSRRVNPDPLDFFIA